MRKITYYVLRITFHEKVVNFMGKIKEKLSYEDFLNWCDEDTLAEWVDGELLCIHPHLLYIKISAVSLRIYCVPMSKQRTLALGGVGKYSC
jgi:hypothetical protein